MDYFRRFTFGFRHMFSYLFKVASHNDAIQEKVYIFTLGNYNRTT